MKNRERRSYHFSRAKALLVVVLLHLSVFGYCQSKNSFEQFKKQNEDNFAAFVRQRNEEFAAFLRQRWEQFETFKALSNEKPLPDNPIFFKPQEMDVNPVVIDVEPVAQVPPEVPKPIEINKHQKPTKPKECHDIKISLYGLNHELSVDKNIIFKLNNIDENSVSDYFNKLTQCNSTQLLEQIIDISNEAGLSNWHYYKLIDNIAKQLFPNQVNEQVLIAFFLLRESNIEAKIGRCSDRLILLMPFVEQIYGCEYLEIEGLSYYIVTTTTPVDKVYTYKSGNAGNVPSILICNKVSLPKHLVNKNVVIKESNLQLTVTYNSNLESLYSDYPQCDVINYARAPMSDELYQSLVVPLKKIVDGKNFEDAANVLINFVQTSFEYKTDPEQFGGQRSFFAEEMFVYPYSDCEDRAILFSQLVRAVLGLDVVLLDYPNHIATAVCFETNDVDGDLLMFEGKKYIVCDPTYINAPIGRTMPQYKTVKPIVLKI